MGRFNALFDSQTEIRRFVIDYSPDGINDWQQLASPSANGTSIGSLSVPSQGTWYFCILAYIGDVNSDYATTNGELGPPE